MRTVDILRAKRQGEALSPESIRAFVRGFTDGSIPDYQASALLMAICLAGMNASETMALTREMLATGNKLDLTHIKKRKVDKHSTGGVGDKTSLIVAPLAAACGLAVPMISGRGLGHTGGTLDKLEAIPGFRVNLSEAEVASIVERVGCAMVGPTEDIAPADKKLYALRDVTGTVESLPLITASILSKKLAEGIDGIVFDVKLGTGAYMKDMENAQKLAASLIDTTIALDTRAVAVISDMSQPLGLAVGNALEVNESVETLQGGGPQDLRELVIALVTEMLTLCNPSADRKDTDRTVTAALDSGEALAIFRAMVEAQGGDSGFIDDPGALGRARHTRDYIAKNSGYVVKMDTEAVGLAAMCLGAGRRRLDDTIAMPAGLSFHHKLGAKVDRGDSIVTLLADDDSLFDEALSHLEDAIRIGGSAPPPVPIIKTVMTRERTS